MILFSKSFTFISIVYKKESHFPNIQDVSL